MEDIQNQFVRILSDSLKEEKPSIYTDIKWEQVLELIERYKVEGIVYENIKNNDLTTIVSEEILNRLKIKVNLIEEDQKKVIVQLDKISKAFNNNEISFIVLGNLATKELYYYPEMRECNKIELLIQEEDTESVKALLFASNYKILEENKDEYKITFIDDKESELIIYYHLCNKNDENKELIIYERTVWKRAIKLELGQTEVLSLDYEDFAVRLCMQIEDNIYKGTNDFKELCDLAMLVQIKGKLVNWDSFLMKAGMYGAEKSSLIIFILCNELLKVDIPKDFDIKKINNKKYVDALINEIFNDSFNKESKEEIAAMVCTDKEIEKSDNLVIKYVMKTINKTKEWINELNSPVTREKLLEWMEI